jgi:hypothetical protein
MSNYTVKSVKGRYLTAVILQRDGYDLSSVGMSADIPVNLHYRSLLCYIHIIDYIHIYLYIYSSASR